MSRTMLSMPIMWALTLVAGCATHETYGDRALPQAERAIIEGYSRYLFLYFEDLQIVSVDGNHVGSQWADASSVSVPWGRHWIQLSVLRNNKSIAVCAFDWTFEAGHHYKLQHLHHQQALLAHPTSPRFTAAISMDVSTPSQARQRLNARAECGQARHCRSASDCAPDRSCERAAGFEFGTCIAP